LRHLSSHYYRQVSRPLSSHYNRHVKKPLYSHYIRQPLRHQFYLL
jgi:hypothetical protein